MISFVFRAHKSCLFYRNKGLTCNFFIIFLVSLMCQKEKNIFESLNLKIQHKTQ